MRRLKLIGVALLALCALGAGVATEAQAITAPYFTIGGTRLVAGKTHNFDIRQLPGKGGFEFNTPAAGVKIKCSTLASSKGTLLGSNAGEPGRDDQVVSFAGCALEAGNGAPNCELANEKGEATTEIVTLALKSELVENVVGGTGGKKLLELIYAVQGQVLFDLDFTGTECTVKETVVTGPVVAEVVLDTASEGPVELGQAPQERSSWLLKFPSPPITEVWLVAGGTGRVRRVGEVAFGDESEQIGTALMLLAGTKFEAERALWSPLP
jgi:hypothetical protein